MRRVEKSGIIQKKHFRPLFRYDNKSSISVLDYRMEMLLLSFETGCVFCKKYAAVKPRHISKKGPIVKATGSFYLVFLTTTAPATAIAAITARATMPLSEVGSVLPLDSSAGASAFAAYASTSEIHVCEPS